MSIKIIIFRLRGIFFLYCNIISIGNKFCVGGKNIFYAQNDQCNKSIILSIQIIFSRPRKIFWTITERHFWNKNAKSSLVTSKLGLGKWKLYVQIECQLSYLMMPILKLLDRMITSLGKWLIQPTRCTYSHQPNATCSYI